MTSYNFQNKFDSLKCCVIIPTYNNASSLTAVLKGVLQLTSNVIVVNDGSTDSTNSILAGFKQITVLAHGKNCGKGITLRNGFKEAVRQGYEYAITIDSDGQHKPEEIPKFLDALEKNPGALIVGARNMDQDSVPATSSFGHKFSNFWYYVETGIKLPDTQTGFRLYPVKELSKMRFYTRKFEFEIEVLVRATWKGVPVNYVPVSVYYAPKNKRISHFRPFRDFTRVSLLNTILVLLALFYYRPLFVWRDFRKKGIAEILGRSESTHKLSAAIGFGVMMGIVPIWGYQTVTALFLAHLLRLKKLVVFWSCNVSMPPIMPFILFLSFKTGEFFVANPIVLSFNPDLSLQAITMGLKQYIIGAVIFAVVAAAIAFVISYLLISLWRMTGKKVKKVNKE